MKAVAHRLSKVKLKTFKVSYSPTYTSYIINHIAANPSHPLYLVQRRRKQELKKEGLWWHATNGIDISKSGCVRTWARRRLRQAFVEELKQKGYDETGKLVDAAAMQDRRDVMNVVRLGKSVDLTGSLRMHGVGPLIPAKFETVKDEVRGVIDALIQSAVDTALGLAGEGEKSSGLGQRSARAGAPEQARRPQERRPLAVPSGPRKKLHVTAEPSRMKPQTASSGRQTRTRGPPPGSVERGTASKPLQTKPQTNATNQPETARTTHDAHRQSPARTAPPRARVRRSVTELDRGTGLRIISKNRSG
ncbi:uncharacterized protein EKO05_0006647 [Ascochyta rabiei]|uniref:Uncharacterized protein n=1 Tax=Didymella rabiei TaxID=5454 RepID=A0A162VZW4_DIDRA|nr:uncharacterized protein EKO05_0006647 [Ascochyta rabiei]KZM18697.1 hypothetical protein ST47_g9996 [Ascochyta rabiei]UPX16236.1 hypothetical protein EKO05_0006647 [Ascochyta rabiei]